MRPNVRDTCSDIAYAQKWAVQVRTAKTVTDVQNGLYNLRESIYDLPSVVPTKRLQAVALRLGAALRPLEAAAQASSTPAEFATRVRASASLRADLRTFYSSVDTLDAWHSAHC